MADLTIYYQLVKHKLIQTLKKELSQKKNRVLLIRHPFLKFRHHLYDSYKASVHRQQ